MEVSESEVAAEFAALEREGAAAATESQPTPGAPPGEGVHASYQESQEEQDLSWQEIIQPLLWGGFSIMAPAWQISAEECQQLSDVYAPLCEKYFPAGPGKWGPEIAAAFVTVHILAPKLGKPRKLPKPRQEGDQGAEKGTDQPGQAGTPEKHQAMPEKSQDGDVEVSAAGLAGVDA